MFSGDPDVLRAGEGDVVRAPVLGSGSVLVLDGAAHLRRRRMIMPPFHGERMRAYGKRSPRWPSARSIAGPRETRSRAAEMQAITLDVILRAVFGLDEPPAGGASGAPLRRLLGGVAGPRRRVAAPARR